MMKTRSSLSAHISVRFLLAVTFCLAGLCLVATALGSWNGLSIVRWTTLEKQSALHAKAHAKSFTRGGAAKTISPASTTRRRTGAANTFSGTQPTVTIHTNQLGQTIYSIAASHFDISPPLSELAALKLPRPPQVQLPELALPASRILRSGQPDPVTQIVPGGDAVNAPAAATAPALATTGFNFDGIAGFLGGYPPDNNGSVGTDQFVEMVNTDYQVWSLNRTSKTATPLLPSAASPSPVPINTLWAGFGGACQTQNAGDPIVLFDKLAKRWFLSQFTSDPDGD